MIRRRVLPPVLGAVVLPLALAACQDPGTLSPHFGNAVRHNMAAHIINPAPAYAPGTLPDHMGRRQALAVERYATGREKEVEVLGTSDVDE